MTDPAAPDTRAQDAVDASIMRIYASSATWQQVVNFHQDALDSSPNPAGPPVAIFQMAGGVELHIIQTDDQALLGKQATQPVWHVPLGSPERVAQVIERARLAGAQIIIPTTTIWVFPLPTEPKYQAVITLGTIRFRAGQQVTPDDATVGAVHNPNW